MSQALFVGLSVAAGSAWAQSSNEQVSLGYRRGQLSDYSSCEIVHPNTRCRAAHGGYGELVFEGTKANPSKCGTEDCGPNFNPWAFVFDSRDSQEMANLLSFLHDYKGRVAIIEYFQPPQTMMSPGFVSSAMLMSIAPSERQLQPPACESAGAAQGRHSEVPLTGYLVGLDLIRGAGSDEWEAIVQNEGRTRFYLWKLEEQPMNSCLLPFLKTGQKVQFYLVSDDPNRLAAARP